MHLKPNTYYLSPNTYNFTPHISIVKNGYNKKRFGYTGACANTEICPIKKIKMKITLTGSLGHISRPLALELIESGHALTVISSNPEKKNEIEAIGAIPAIGSVTDLSFLQQTFSEADAVYCMTPPDFSEPDQVAYYEHTAQCYAAAVNKTGVKRVIYLSSYGAHLPAGTGFITGSHHAEKIFDQLAGVSLTYIRPGYFYYNLLGFINMIRSAGYIGAVYGEKDKLAIVSPDDIAAAIADEILRTDSPDKVRYVVSDDRTCNEIATVLGNAIGIPGLQWRILPEEQVKQSLLAAGIPGNAVLNLMELGQATHSGILREDFEKNKIISAK